MQITIFGKAACSRCRTTKNKIAHLLDKHGLTDKVQVVYHDLDTADGMAEGAFHDVAAIPAVIVAERDEQLRRWDGQVPNSQELKKLLVNE